MCEFLNVCFSCKSKLFSEFGQFSTNDETRKTSKKIQTKLSKISDPKKKLF